MSGPSGPASASAPPAALPAPRPAGRDDLDALCELERDGFDDPWSRAALGSLIPAPQALLLVIQDPAPAPVPPAEPPPGTPLVAYALWTRVLDEAELLRLAVASGARRRGLARTLLAAGAQRLAAAGCTTCYLEVRASNAAAIALYESSGFHRLGLRRGYYQDGGDALLYAGSVARTRTSAEGSPPGSGRAPAGG